MTETTKEIFENYQVRKTKRQKTAFIEYVKQLAEGYGYDFKVEKGAFGVRNIVIGNPDTAKVLYTAHYDTCARLPFPNFITPKNFLIYLLYQFLIVGAFFVLAFALGFIIGLIVSFIPMADDTAYLILSILPQAIYLALLYLLVGGPANKNTANDNTSGVTTVLDIMEKLPQDQKDKVAFVLFDLEESGLFGSSSFASKHKAIKNNTLVINFDCVSDGQTMLFALKRTTKKYADLLERAFVSTSDISVDITKNAFYPSDNASFKGGIGVAALKKSKLFGTLYMDRIHTNKDVIYREENIEFLTNGAIKLAQML
ncbi:MAG: M28 family peptidase [Oscillospiraceae bacterium]|nr:M28 family peptidase [Oscillospiraceae bacterium]